METSKSAREYSLKAFYNKKDMTIDLQKHLLSCAYIDPASDKSDNISITLHDKDNNWGDGWMPELGASISIIFSEFSSKANLQCENFYIDSISANGGTSGSTIQIGAVSTPQATGFSDTKNNNTWSNTTIQEIAKKIIDKHSLQLFYNADKINIENIEQRNATDSEFLINTCKDYGLYVKIYSNKIIIFDREKYKTLDIIATITPQDVLNWTYNTDLKGYYSAGKLSYQTTDGDSETVEIGEGDRVLTVNKQATSIDDAELKLNAALNDANHSITTMEISTPGNITLYSTQIIAIKNFGKIYDGKYYIDEVSHSLSGSYTCKYKLSKIVNKSNIDILSSALDKLLKNNIINNKDYWLQNYKNITNSDTFIIVISSKITQSFQSIHIKNAYDCLITLWKNKIILLKNIPVYNEQAQKTKNLMN